MNNKTAVSEQIIRPTKGWIHLNYKELWRYRELIYFLTIREILVRYKQTVLGIAWAIIQPVMIMIIFTFVFGSIAKLPSEGIPYPILTFVALIPWQFFAYALSQSGQSVVANAQIVSKIYFPRIIIPVSSVISGAVDFTIAFAILIGLMFWYKIFPSINIIYLPLFFLLAALAALGFGLWLSALNVAYRDVKYIIPFIVQMGLYISPVGFLTSVIPRQYRLIYSFNPMVGVIDGFRWCLLGGKASPPIWLGLLISIGIVFVILFSGAFYFRKTEKTFADII